MPTVPNPTVPTTAPRDEQVQRKNLARLSARSADLTASFSRTLSGARDAQSRLASIGVSSSRGAADAAEVSSDSPLAQKAKKKLEGPGASDGEPGPGGADTSKSEHETGSGESLRVDSEGEATGTESSPSDTQAVGGQASGALDAQEATQRVLESKPAPETAHVVALTLLSGGDSLRLALVPEGLRTTWATIGNGQAPRQESSSGARELDRSRQAEAEREASASPSRAQTHLGGAISSAATSGSGADDQGGGAGTKNLQQGEPSTKASQSGGAAELPAGEAGAGQEAARSSTASGRPLSETSLRPSVTFLNPALARAGQQGREATGTESRAPGVNGPTGTARAALPQGGSGAARNEAAPASSAFDARLQQAIQSQATRALSAAVNSQTGAVTLRLNPATLGQLKVLVSVEKNAVTAKFEATTPKAKALLEDARETLKEGLKEKGLAVDKIEITLAPRFPERDLGLGAIPRPRGQDSAEQSQGVFGTERGAQTTDVGAGSADLGGFGGQSATGGFAQSGSGFAEHHQHDLLSGAEDLVPIQLQGLSYRVDASGRLSVDALA